MGKNPDWHALRHVGEFDVRLFLAYQPSLSYSREAEQAMSFLHVSVAISLPLRFQRVILRN